MRLTLCRIFDACSFETEIFCFWLSEKRRRRRERRPSIFTTPKRKRSRGAAAERTPVGTGRICSGAALQALEIGPLCLRTCALLRNKYGSFGLFDRSASALRAMREREGTHTAWYASRRDMTVSQSRHVAAALFSRSTPFKTDCFLVWRQLCVDASFAVRLPVMTSRIAPPQGIIGKSGRTGLCSTISPDGTAKNHPQNRRSGRARKTPFPLTKRVFERYNEGNSAKAGTENLVPYEGVFVCRIPFAAISAPD